MTTLKILQNHIAKLKADNEYLERQIAFLSDRLKTSKKTLGDNVETIYEIKEAIERLALIVVNPLAGA
jgi:chromosome segregation ATPase